MPLQTVSGSLTLINVNTPDPVVAWNGQQLESVLSVASTNRRNASRRTAIRVIDPADPALDLSPEQFEIRNAIYAEMTAAGIDILKR